MHDPNEPIWNLSIEDLLVVPAEQIALANKGPFVVNLTSTSTPSRIPGVLPGFEQRRTYRLSQTEHGRPRYRLRLGFFDTREEADLALNRLRDKFPSAFVTSAREADLRYAPEEVAARARAQRAPEKAAPAAAAASAARPQAPAARPATTKTPAKEPRHEAKNAQRPARAAPPAKPVAAPAPCRPAPRTA